MRKRTQSVNKFTFRKNFKLQPIALSLMVAFGVVACSGEDVEQLTIYGGVEDCVNNNPNMVAECKAVYENAVKEAIETAPKYATLDECTADFGAENCQSVEKTSELLTQNQSATTQHTPSFMPLLAGFMMGRMMSGMNANNMAHKPVYSPKDATGRPSNFYDSSGKNYGAARSGSTVAVPKSDIKSKPAGTMQRGGFGKMAAQQRIAAQQKANSKSTSARKTSSFGG